MNFWTTLIFGRRNAGCHIGFHSPLFVQILLTDHGTLSIMARSDFNISLNPAVQAELLFDWSCHVRWSLLPSLCRSLEKIIFFFPPYWDFFCLFLFLTFWKFLRINSPGFVFPAESLNGSLLVVPLWKVGCFRSSTGEFERIAEASLYLMVWAFLLHARPGWAPIPGTDGKLHISRERE